MDHCRLRFTSCFCLLTLLACSEAQVTIDDLSASAAMVTAGEAVTVRWSTTNAASIDLTDTEGRPLLLAGPPLGSVEVAILQSTRLRLIARGETADGEAMVAVAAVPRLAATLELSEFAAGETQYVLRWDSLGATSHELRLADQNVTDFTGGKLGTFAGTAAAPDGGRVALRLEARAGDLVQLYEANIDVFAGEREPNDTTATRQPIARGVVGRSSPDDPDVYGIDIPEGGNVIARLRDTSGGCGAPGALRLTDSRGVTRASVVSLGGCAELTPTTAVGDRDLPGGSYSLTVIGAAPTDYLLEVQVSAPSCGNGVVESRGGEHCELSEETCNADCTVDSIPEVEPNDRNADAQLIPLDVIVAGRVDTPGARDTDVYVVELTSPTHLDISVTGPGISGCAFVVGGVALRTGAGTTLANAPMDHLGRWCGRLEGHEAGLLSAGRYLIVVELLDVEGPEVPRYFLRVQAVAPTVCGDGRRAGGEECDDSNLTAGDGCNSNCMLEPLARITRRPEPHVIAGGPLPEGGAALVELAFDSSGLVILDVFAPAVGRCDAGNDLRMTLDGELLSDDGGVGACPGRDMFISIAGPPEVRRLVISSGSGSGPFTLVARLVPTGMDCGNLILQTLRGESCDDGNLVSGDGCSSACAIEPTAASPIAPNTPIAVPALNERGRSVVFPLSVSEADTRVVVRPIAFADGFCPELYDLTVHDETLSFVGGRASIQRGECNVAAARVVSAGRHYLAVRNAGRAPIHDFSVEVTFEAPTCGDGVRTEAIGEACDDANRAVGDGCDDQCRIETGYLAELEPNDTATTANVLYVRTSSQAEESVVLAAHRPPSDPTDFFVIDNSSGAPMWLDVHAEQDAECQGDFTFRLTDVLGVLIAERAPGMIVECIQFSPADRPALAALPPGRYFLEVSSRGRPRSTYFLHGRFGAGVFQ